MVQDIRDSYYYYSFVMKRPFKADEKFMLYRWGNQPEGVSEEALESNEYMKVMIDRDTVICTPVLGLTDWAAELEGRPEQIELMVDNKGDFKLGEIVNVVAFYHPDHHKLYFLRKATEEEVQKEQLNPLVSLQKAQIDFEVTRQALLGFLGNHCS
jgi:predicted nucleic acid-binding Zn ribbon protein